MHIYYKVLIEYKDSLPRYARILQQQQKSEKEIKKNKEFGDIVVFFSWSNGLFGDER